MLSCFLSVDLLCWTLSYLMRLLCRQDCSELRDNVLRVVPNILLMVKSKDVHVFHKMCAELVMALAGEWSAKLGDTFYAFTRPRQKCFSRGKSLLDSLGV